MQFRRNESMAAKDLGGGAGRPPPPRSFAAMVRVPATIPAAQDDRDRLRGLEDAHGALPIPAGVLHVAVRGLPGLAPRRSFRAHFDRLAPRFDGALEVFGGDAQ